MAEDSFEFFGSCGLVGRENSWVSDRGLGDHRAVEIAGLGERLVEIAESAVADDARFGADFLFEVADEISVDGARVPVAHRATVDGNRVTKFCRGEEKFELGGFVRVGQARADFDGNFFAEDLGERFDDFEGFGFFGHHPGAAAAGDDFGRGAADVEFDAGEIGILFFQIQRGLAERVAVAAVNLGDEIFFGVGACDVAGDAEGCGEVAVCVHKFCPGSELGVGF